VTCPWHNPQEDQPLWKANWGIWSMSKWTQESTWGAKVCSFQSKEIKTKIQCPKWKVELYVCPYTSLYNKLCETVQQLYAENGYKYQPSFKIGTRGGLLWRW